MRYLFSILMLCFISACSTPSPYTAERSSEEMRKIEQSFLAERAFLLKERRAARAASGIDESMDIDLPFRVKYEEMKAELIARINKVSFRFPETKRDDLIALEEQIYRADFDTRAPFDLLNYLSRYQFESWNTFTVPENRRKKVLLEFRDGRQFTNGKVGQYKIRQLGSTMFKRERPLAGGGQGVDIILYNVFLNRFEKKGRLFMWLAE